MRFSVFCSSLQLFKGIGQSSYLTLLNKEKNRKILFRLPEKYECDTIKKK